MHIEVSSHSLIYMHIPEHFLDLRMHLHSVRNYVVLLN